MNADLEAQLAEMGPEFAGLGAALCRASGACTGTGFTMRVMADVAAFLVPKAN